MVVEVDELRKVAVEYRNDVNIFQAVKESRNLYEAVKLVGAKNVTVKFKKNLMDVEENVTETSTRLRALAGRIMMDLYHMRDSATSISRLEEHFGSISFEAAIGYRFKEKEIKVSEKSIKDMLEEYIGGKELEEHYGEVPATNLYNLVIRRKNKIELLPLWSEIEQLYESVVTVGLDNTTIWFSEDEIPKATLKGQKIPERIRAFAMFVVILMYRLGENNFRSGCYHIDDDPHIRLLREKFGLGNSIELLLGDTEIFIDSKDEMKCLSLDGFVGRYLKTTEYSCSVPESPMCMQVAYNVIQKKVSNGSEEEVINLWHAMDALYKISKFVGVKNAKVFFKNSNGEEVRTVAEKLSPRIRAFCEETVIYMYRMKDSEESRSRLEEHLGLDTPSKIILGDTNVVSCGSSMPCVSLKELLERLLG